jgi:hypothetical protein
METRRMNLAICIPCRDQVCTGFAYDLARLSAYFGARRVPKGDKLFLFTSAGTLIADQRINLAREALNAGADYVLYLDSDMRFPKDGFDRLFAHQKPIVAANYSTRRLPCKPVAFADPICRELVYTNKDSAGIEKVYAVGMGFMLVDTKVFKAMPQPWFQIGYSAESGDFFGEDVFFCHQAAKHGFDTHIDHDVSKEVKHIGNFEFSNEHAEAQREIVEAEGIQTAKRSAA